MNGGTRSDEHKALDAAVTVLQDNAPTFAKLAIANKRALLREAMDRILVVADRWVADGSKAKGIPVENGEEWLTGPVPLMRNLRLLEQTLARLEEGRPTIAREQIRRRSDHRLEVIVFPASTTDGALFTGFEIAQVMEPGMEFNTIKERAGACYQDQRCAGDVSLVLGAGNVSSIAPSDALYKNFAEGSVCIIKMNPVNEWVGPHLEYAFKPFIDKGYLRIVYGGGDVGAYLVNHAGIDAIHITGSNHTHDMIVWGPPGEEREWRMRQKAPLLNKRISSELGNVSPVAVVPAEYSRSELEFMARNVAAMVTNNASFNCNAAKVLITATGWAQRAQFMGAMERAMQNTPTRPAYYPGAFDRYHELVGDRESVKTLGRTSATVLPWTILYDVDPARTDDPLFRIEPFCPIISQTSLDANEPAAFVQQAAEFMNATLHGTLNATFLVQSRLERAGEVAVALDHAIMDLRYGTVTVNHWAALGFAAMSPVWGGHPSSTLEDAQSGLGWVHNTYLLEGVEKSVLRGPLKVFPKPAWFGDNRKTAAIGAKLLALEHSPGWLKLPGIALTAMQG